MVATGNCTNWRQKICILCLHMTKIRISVFILKFGGRGQVQYLLDHSGIKYDLIGPHIKCIKL